MSVHPGRVLVAGIGAALATVIGLSHPPAPSGKRARGTFSTRPACFGERIPAFREDRTTSARIATKETDDKLVESVAGSSPDLGQGAVQNQRRRSWARSRSSQPHSRLCWYRRSERTPLRGAPNTAAEEVEEPIVGSIPSPNAWPRFPAPAVSAPEINSRIHVGAGTAADGTTDRSSQAVRRQHMGGSWNASRSSVANLSAVIPGRATD